MTFLGWSGTRGPHSGSGSAAASSRCPRVGRGQRGRGWRRGRRRRSVAPSAAGGRTVASSRPRRSRGRPTSRPAREASRSGPQQGRDLLGPSDQCLPVVEHGGDWHAEAGQLGSGLDEPAVGPRHGPVVREVHEPELDGSPHHVRRQRPRQEAPRQLLGAKRDRGGSPISTSSPASTPMTASSSRPCSHWWRSPMPASECP
jgi:hypothetical protein